MKLKLKRLLLQGFKSFKDRTVVQFDEGITGIVGPNGCGKSNIVDALFWVMGEQSAKHLRGKSMQDVIFAGSDKYSPAPWAEVTLVLGNEGGKSIHIGTSVARPSEIQITRKLYRNGESEYRINGMPARLKDVQEVFMDTGAGAKSYSIIAQGEINRLVQAKPEERRLMIEEVAGITKFKLRRRDSLKKIEQTQQNLDRLKDLQNEIDKNLKNLKRQAEKAEEARSLKERIRKYDLVVSSHQVFDALKDYRDGKNFVRSTQLEIEGQAARKLSLENSIAEERIQKDEMTIHLDDKQSEFNQSSKALAALEERQKYIQKAIKEKSQLLERLHNEKQETLKQLEGRRSREQQLVTDLKQLEEQASLEVNFDELQELVENLREQVQLKQSDLDERSEVIRDLENERYSLDQTLFKNNSRLEEYSTQLQDLSKEIELIEEQFSGFSKTVSTERESVLGLQTVLPQLEARINVLKASQDELKIQIKEKENFLRQQQKILMGKEGRLSSLVEIRRSLQGLSLGTQEFLSTGPKSEYARVGQLIECSDEFTPAVQALLENLFESLVGQDKGKELCQWANQSQMGGWAYCLPRSDADFGPKESLERLKLCNLGNIWPLQDIVKINNPEFQQTMTALLDGLYIAENLDIEKIQSLSSDIKIKALVAKDGSFLIQDNGTYRVWMGRTLEDASAGEVARNNEIKSLEESLVKEREEFLAQEMDADLLRSALNQNELELDQVRLDFSNQRADYASKKQH